MSNMAENLAKTKLRQRRGSGAAGRDPAQCDLGQEEETQGDQRHGIGTRGG